MKHLPRILTKFIAVLCWLLLVGSNALAGKPAAEFVSLDTRPGVKQNFMLIVPPNPVATAILFTGGSGRLDIRKSLWGNRASIGQSSSNFVVRTRRQYVAAGIMVAVVDAPSDKKNKHGMFRGFRDSDKHVVDIDAVIAYLRKRANVPVWLVGTSRGTESATHIAISSTQSPDGLVLASPMSRKNSKGTPVTRMVIKGLRIPVLIVAHEKDGCRVTPPAGAQKIENSLKTSQRKELKYFSGGLPATSIPCSPMAEHGFLGIEKKVVAHIIKFILVEK